MASKDNANPTVHEVALLSRDEDAALALDDEHEDALDALEVFGAAPRTSAARAAR